jgi:hypothetical protein
MQSDTENQAYICSSAHWGELITDVKSPMEAATEAIARQFDNADELISFSSNVTVTPVKLLKEEQQEFSASALLADMGFHEFAADLARNLSLAQEEKNKNSKNEQ